jgi:uncharacterized coiled-coil DUF342 family protein
MSQKEVMQQVEKLRAERKATEKAIEDLFKEYETWEGFPQEAYKVFKELEKKAKEIHFKILDLIYPNC